MNNKFENENYTFAQNCSERQKLSSLLEPQKGAPNGKTNGKNFDVNTKNFAGKPL